MQFLSSLAVLATEEGEESSGGLSLVLPHTEELIAGILAFAIVFFFVWKWALPTINKTLEARQEAITGQLTEAERAKARGRGPARRLQGSARRGQVRRESHRRRGASRR